MTSITHSFLRQSKLLLSVSTRSLTTTSRIGTQRCFAKQTITSYQAKEPNQDEEQQYHLDSTGFLFATREELGSEIDYEKEDVVYMGNGLSIQYAVKMIELDTSIPRRMQPH